MPLQLKYTVINSNRSKVVKLELRWMQFGIYRMILRLIRKVGSLFNLIGDANVDIDIAACQRAMDARLGENSLHIVELVRLILIFQDGLLFGPYSNTEQGTHSLLGSHL
jgi:hypothetical protein